MFTSNIFKAMIILVAASHASATLTDASDCAAAVWGVSKAKSIQNPDLSGNETCPFPHTESSFLGYKIKGRLFFTYFYAVLCLTIANPILVY